MPMRKYRVLVSTYAIQHYTQEVVVEAASGQEASVRGTDLAVHNANWAKFGDQRLSADYTTMVVPEPMMGKLTLHTIQKEVADGLAGPT